MARSLVRRGGFRCDTVDAGGLRRLLAHCGSLSQQEGTSHMENCNDRSGTGRLVPAGYRRGPAVQSEQLKQMDNMCLRYVVLSREADPKSRRVPAGLLVPDRECPPHDSQIRGLRCLHTAHLQALFLLHLAPATRALPILAKADSAFTRQMNAS